MTRQEAADWLGVTATRVSRLILEGRLKATRHGVCSWNIRLADLKRLKLGPVGRPTGWRKKKVATVE